MTFSIMATDPETNQIGYAVASKTFYVGMIGFIKPAIGAILCQGKSNLKNGPFALNMIEKGYLLNQIIDELKGIDSRIESQQLGLVDAVGNVYAFTGSECNDWAGHKMKKGYTCQGNILTGGDVLEGMCEAFESSEGLLVERLMAALLAGDNIGGDSRGKQSASLKVVSPGGGFGGSDIVADLHIYDHVEPVAELARITDIAVGYMKQFLV
jgi:uncharacterized Ntn-hydrolase superfamily protein